MESLDYLTDIFEHQKELMRQFHPIEERNGFHRPDPMGLNLDRPLNQDRLRGLAWHTIEEFTEALDEPGESRLEELADTFHFLVELLITSGVTPSYLRQNIQMEPLAGLMAYGVLKNWPSYDEKELTTLQLSFVVCLGAAMNTLKNRPWKQTMRETDIAVYFMRLRVATIEFLTVVAYMGYPAAELHRAYIRKNDINHQRIQGGT